MALVQHCFCCSVQIASGFFAAYLLVAYLIGFAFELLWILESDKSLPAAAVLLCAGYFTMALFAALLIHGLATKTSLCLIAWMFAVAVLTFPEAGMVIYMSIQYWKIESLYGVTELICWLIRIVVTVIEIILIQSLYTTWREEEIVDKRLRALGLSAMGMPDDNLATLNSQYYQNNGYQHSLEQINSNLMRYGSMPHLWPLPNNLASLPFEGYQFCTTQSEFNASIFVPNIINYTNNETGKDILMQAEKAAMQILPEKSRDSYDKEFKIFASWKNSRKIKGKKAQSLMDLRLLADQSLMGEKINNQIQPWLAQSITESNSEVKHGPRLTKCQSVDALNDIMKDSHIIRNRTGFYAQPIANFGVPVYYGPLDGPDFLIYKKQVDKLTSKNSLSNTSADDVRKYRDVQL